MMEMQQDFKELLASFNVQKVEYLLVGGYALAFHGAPRYTGDLEILVRPDHANGKRILAALSDFGFGLLGLTVEDFEKSDRVVQLGHPPIRIDIMTSLTGVSWEEASSGRVAGNFGNVPVFFIGRNQLLANKRAIGRMRDLADIEALENK